MLRVALFCGVLAMAAAECGFLERQVVKTQWAKAYGIANDRIHFAEEIWEQ